MAQEKIIISFQAKGAKPLIDAINRLDKATNQLKGRYKELGKSGGILDTQGKRNAKGMDSLANAFSVVRSKLLLLNFGLSMGATQLAKFAQEAAKVENMERAFNTLSGGTENASIAMDKLQLATNDTMTQMDLFQQANNAMILGVSKNSDEMAEMFDIAQRLGRALGRDTRSSVESLITGIGRQSRLMLDNIGIIVKADEAYESYAERLGTTADKLTDADKKTAFLEATMESARAKVASLGDEVKSTQDSYDTLIASLGDASVSLGGFVAKIGELPEKAEEAARQLKIFSEILDAPSYESFSNFLKVIIDDLLMLSITANPLLNMFNSITGVFDSTTTSGTLMREETEKIVSNLPPLADAIGEMVEKYGTGLRMVRFENDGLKDSFIQFAVASTQAGAALKLKEDHLEKLKVLYPELAKQLDLLGKKEKTYYATSLSGLRSMIKSKLQMYFAEAVAGMMAVEFSTKGIGGFLVASAGAIAIDKFFQDHVPQFQQGGVVGGNRHSQGGTMIEAERGEFVMSRKAVDSIGVDNLNAMNEGGGGAITVNINGGMIDQNFVENELAESIKTAIRRGSDFGVS